jgi:hypothetical protein
MGNIINPYAPKRAHSFTVVANPSSNLDTIVCQIAPSAAPKGGVGPVDLIGVITMQMASGTNPLIVSIERASSRTVVGSTTINVGSPGYWTATVLGYDLIDHGEGFALCVTQTGAGTDGITFSAQLRGDWT